jgi:D-alanine-D-alanine ligase
MEQLKQSARTAFQVLGCQDVARIDFRMDAEGEACFLEINPLPGLAPGYSDLPMIAKAAGYDYDSFVCAIFDAACARLAGGSHETH